MKYEFVIVGLSVAVALPCLALDVNEAVMQTIQEQRSLCQKNNLQICQEGGYGAQVKVSNQSGFPLALEKTEVINGSTHFAVSELGGGGVDTVNFNASSTQLLFYYKNPLGKARLTCSVYNYSLVQQHTYFGYMNDPRGECQFNKATGVFTVSVPKFDTTDSSQWLIP